MKITLTIIIYLLCLISVPSYSAAEIIVIVHPESTVSAISKNELKRLFLGKSRRIKGLSKKVQAINLPESDSSRSEFAFLFLRKTKQQLRSYWVNSVFSGKARPPVVATDSTNMKKLVSNDLSAIGYIDKKNLDSSVKILSLIP